ncbi:MAG: metallophosphoesterase family protein [Planctomycetota bacterium]
MKIAIISDIHANAEALRAVLADIDQQEGIEKLVCLGDIVGYGPHPTQCIDTITERCEWCLMGNHDFGVLYEPTNFNPGAEQAAFWTREQIEKEPDEGTKRRRFEFLGHLRIRVRFGPDNQLVAVHGSPRRPINEYIFPDDAINGTLKIQQIFDHVERGAVLGHSHVAGVFTDEPDFYSPNELKHRFNFQDGEKFLINVGSVGQPRDGDPRASYAVLDDEGVTFRRIEYDIDAVASEIRANPMLNDWLADRLYEGR